MSRMAAVAKSNNPQREQMSDESMLRNLSAQAEAIWPQEKVVFERYGLAPGARILDLGCGPGELSERLLEALPTAKLVGIDLDAAHLERARKRCARFGERATFELGDAVELDLPSESFDVAVCRHLLQAVPTPERVVAQMARVTRPGGRLHIVAEDYGMMHFHPTQHDIDKFWTAGPIAYATSLGTDLRSGRKIYTILRSLGLRDIRVDYIVIDTVRVERSVFSRIWSAWRDGYTDVIAQHTGLDRDDVDACFRDMIDCIENPDGYAVWQLPVVTGLIAG